MARTRAPRSLLDAVDLRRVRAAVDDGDAVGAVLACLLDAGVVQHDPADAGWADRDRVLVDPTLPLRVVAAAFARAGYPADEGRWGQGPAQVAADALRLARSSRVGGEIFRVFCLFDAASLRLGAVWETLVAAAAEALSPLCLVVVAPQAAMAPDPATVLAAAGWQADECGADPASVLAALDRALAAPGPCAVVVRSG